MDKVKEFLANHDLKKELTNDESFVEESKKLFEEQGLEFSKEQLEEIVGDICNNLEDVKELPENDLENIVGGVLKGDPQTPKLESQKKAARIAVEATGSILGILIGGGLGLGLGAEFNYSNKDHKLESTKYKAFPTVVGAGAGSIIGYKLGKLIADKYKL